jgi:hypothetical protein
MLLLVHVALLLLLLLLCAVDHACHQNLMALIICPDAASCDTAAAEAATAAVHHVHMRVIGPNTWPLASTCSKPAHLHAQAHHHL